MSASIKQSVSGDLSELVSDLLVEFRGFDGPDGRTVPREYVTAAVMVYQSSKRGGVQGFSRDISAEGIGLVTSGEIVPNSVATLAIDRFDGTSAQLEAICRWCRPYGPNWTLSGWEFLRLVGVRRY